MTFLSDVKIDINISMNLIVSIYFFYCEPPPQSRCLISFYNLTSFDILAHYLNHHSLSEAGGQGWVKGTCDMYPLHGVYGPVPI